MKVLSRIAEKRRACRVIGPVKSLQRVPYHQLLLDGISIGQGKAPANGIEQFTDQHRGRQLAVIPDALADIAYIEQVTGRKDRLKKEVTVFITQ